MSAGVSSTRPNCPVPSVSSTGSEVCPKRAISKSWMAAAPFIAIAVNASASRSERRGRCTPVLMTWPPSIAIAGRPSARATTQAWSNSRSEARARRSGRNCSNVPMGAEGSGADANCSIRTLFGRFPMEIVLTARRSISGWRLTAERSLLALKREAHVGQADRDRADRNLALHHHRDPARVVREPNENAALGFEYALRFEDRLHDDAVERSRRHLDALPLVDLDLHVIALLVVVRREQDRPSGRQGLCAHIIERGEQVVHARRHVDRGSVVVRRLVRFLVEANVDILLIGALAQVFHEPARVERLGVDVALGPVANLVELRDE